MTTGLDHPLVAEYLQRLDDAARVLPPARHAELVAEISSHLAEGLRETDSTEAEIRNMLQRLGSPAEIVAEADEDGRPPGFPASTSMPAAAPPVTTGKQPTLWLEIAAVVFLTVGSILIPVIGWLIGIALLWMSRWLRVWEKLLATLVIPGGLGGMLIAGLVLGGPTCVESQGSSSTAGSTDGVTSTCGTTSWWEHVLPWAFAGVLVLSLVIPLVLLVAARNRAARSQP